ncbi:hypothetical protein RHMOL_Rhmol05G0041600 [Rhododendron molle]|uniref:Uncharacterized protein n=1 Tax=Rhododendron molle TaxID=49168 RepID=A0ACC0NKP7_RHOML|nr:hypothetical protein RHMOL_Rhmol05G0041600 [Rhododendron molle]
MEQRNVSSWTSMIVGYAMHGQVIESLGCFRCMRKDGVRPNSVTFVGVLSACVHGGMVQDGKRYFRMMESEYGIMPKLRHYGCMVDLLGRARLLEEAREMVVGMPMEANVVIWGCLMGACEKYGNVKMGEWVCKHFLELEPWNDGVYVVLSNIYASKEQNHPSTGFTTNDQNKSSDPSPSDLSKGDNFIAVTNKLKPYCHPQSH